MAGIDGFPGFIKSFTRGSTKDFTIQVKKNGEVLDITGASFVVSFATELTADGTPDLTVTIDPPTDPTNGKTTGQITDTQSWSLPAGKIYYTVRYINSDGKPYVIDRGRIEIFEAIPGES